MPADLTQQLDTAARLVIAAVLGAAIGFEREIHDHPAGMRTHLLVALGSALFTVVSIFGFVGAVQGQAAVDPSRVAAQVVTGIGFLGAGAILKYGTSIRGLTTAASLWATAAIGMAVGTGAYLVAAIATGIVLISLWPLNWVVDRIHGPAESLVHDHLRHLFATGVVADLPHPRRRCERLVPGVIVLAELLLELRFARGDRGRLDGREEVPGRRLGRRRRPRERGRRRQACCRGRIEWN